MNPKPDSGGLQAGPAPHNWLDALKRAPLHLAGFGIPFGIAAHFAPFPWNLAIAGGLGVWRAIAERGDFKGKRDTGPKAVIDFATQVAGAAVGALVR